ncbi:histone-lysine N-methyltransferase PRDM9 [Tachysurus ichikawai]
METDGLLTSCGGTSDPVGHIGPEDQWNGEFQKKPIKEEEPDDEEYFYGGTSSFVEHLIPVVRQDKGFQEKHLKEEEPEDDNQKCSTDGIVHNFDFFYVHFVSLDL